MTKFFICLYLVLCLTSCFPVTANGFKKIKYNDTEDEVVKILGAPYTKKNYYNKEYFIYYVHDDVFSLFFSKSRFPFIGFYPFLRTGEEYWVIFENGKVVSFGNSSNFNNSIPRALSNNGISVDLDRSK